MLKLIKKHDVFISYKAEEYAEASWTRSVLEENGLSCWMAPESIPGGSSYADEIEEAIKSSSVFVLILSEKAQSSQWIKKELDMALGNGLVVLPFMIENCQLHKAFNYYLTDVQRYYAYTSKSNAMSLMIARIKGVIGRENVETVQISKTQDKPGGNQPTSTFKKRYFRIILVGVVYALGLLLPLVLFLLKTEFFLWMRIVYFLWILGGAYWIWNRIETHPEFAALCFGTLTVEDLDNTVESVFSKITSVFGKKAFVSSECPHGFDCYCSFKRLEFGSWDGTKLNYLKIEFKRSIEWYDPSVLYLHSLSRGGQAVKMLTRQGFVLRSNPKGVSPRADFLSNGSMHVLLYYKGKSLSMAEIYNCETEEMEKHIMHKER